MYKNVIIFSAFILSLQTCAAPSAKKLEFEAGISSMDHKNLKGDVLLESVKEGLHVKAHVTGLEPNSKHGFHVHEKGECAGPDYKSAGGHFNPTNEKHGGPDSKTSHFGDLGNLVADEKGEAHVDVIISHSNMSHFKELSGKAVLIHDKGDDLTSQPAGSSGDRIACGVLKKM